MRIREDLTDDTQQELHYFTRTIESIAAGRNPEEQEQEATLLIVPASPTLLLANQQQTTPPPPQPPQLLRLPSLTTPFNELALQASIYDQSRSLVISPRTPEEQRVRRFQELQLITGVRIPTTPSEHDLLDTADRLQRRSSQRAHSQQLQSGAAQYSSIATTTSSAYGPDAADGTPLYSGLTPSPRYEAPPAGQSGDSTSNGATDYFGQVERILGRIQALEEHSQEQKEQQHKEKKQQQQQNTARMPSIGNVAEEQQTSAPVANGHARASSHQRPRQLAWQQEVKHFRLRSHLPQEELLGSINLPKQFISTIFEGELHAFFIAIEIAIGVYVFYLATAALGIWPREFNAFAAYIAGLLKGASLGVALVTGFVRFGTTGRTVSSRRRQRVATPEEEVGQFRVEVAFSLAVYLLIITVFWENLPHAQYVPAPDSEATLSLRVLRTVTSKLGYRPSWDRLEAYLTSFGHSAASTASSAADEYLAPVVGPNAAAAAGESVAGALRPSAPVPGMMGAQKGTGVTDALFRLVGVPKERVFGTKTLFERVDGFIDQYIGWELV